MESFCFFEDPVFDDQFRMQHKVLVLSYLLYLSVPMPEFGMDGLRATLKYCVVALAGTVYAVGWLFLSALAAVGQLICALLVPLLPNIMKLNLLHTHTVSKHKHGHLRTGSLDSKVSSRSTATSSQLSTTSDARSSTTRSETHQSTATSSPLPTSDARSSTTTTIEGSDTSSGKARKVHVRFSPSQPGQPILRSTSSESVLPPSDAYVRGRRQHRLFRMCSSHSGNNGSSPGPSSRPASAPSAPRVAKAPRNAPSRTRSDPPVSLPSRLLDSSAPIVAEPESDARADEAPASGSGTHDCIGVRKFKAKKTKSPPPLPRTDPYQAPYFFPTPRSPEAVDYVRRVRSDWHVARTGVSEPPTGRSRSKETLSPPRTALVESPPASRRTSYDFKSQKMPASPLPQQFLRRAVSSDVRLTAPPSDGDASVSEDGHLGLARSATSAASRKEKRSWRSRFTHPRPASVARESSSCA